MASNNAWRQHFGRDAGDLVQIATSMAGFDLQTVLLRCFKRGKGERIAVPTVEAVLQELSDEWNATELREQGFAS